jgi:predicted molibdopterin-dependent oxidoreductase YjgC
VNERRIELHPILGPRPERRQIMIHFGDRPLPASEGEPIAAALLAAGVKVFRKTSQRGEPRQLFCGIGRCTDCAMIVDGLPGVRTCVTPVRDGMRVEVQDGRGRWESARGGGKP